MKSFTGVAFVWIIVYAVLLGCPECEAAEPILYFSADNGMAIAEARGKLVPGKSRSAIAGEEADEFWEMYEEAPVLQDFFPFGLYGSGTWQLFDQHILPWIPSGRIT
jgi:hypothetical protein